MGGRQCPRSRKPIGVMLCVRNHERACSSTASGRSSPSSMPLPRDRRKVRHDHSVHQAFQLGRTPQQQGPGRRILFSDGGIRPVTCVGSAFLWAVVRGTTARIPNPPVHTLGPSHGWFSNLPSWRDAARRMVPTWYLNRWSNEWSSGFQWGSRFGTVFFSIERVTGSWCNTIHITIWRLHVSLRLQYG